MLGRKELAQKYFVDGYNCSQSVVLAYADLLGIEEKSLAKLASSFGGGMGRLREVCGAASGMFMVLGLLYGYDDPKASEEKKEQYRKVQEAAKAFEEKNGSIVCRQLLGLDVNHDEYTPSERTKEYYQKRPCKELVGDAADILEEFLAKYPDFS